jgi:signal transduction histidine kinase
MGFSMKQLQSKLWAKICAIILFCISLVICAASAAGIYACACYNVYSDGGQGLRENTLSSLVYSQMDDILDEYTGAVQNPELMSYFQQRYDQDSSNLSITIRDVDGNVVYQNYTVTAAQFTHSWPVGQGSDEYGITASVGTELPANDSLSNMLFWVNLLIAWRFGLIAIAVISLLVVALVFVFLLCAAGHKEGVEGIHANWVDRIPFDLYLLLLVAVGILCGAGLGAGWEGLIPVALLWPPLVVSLMMSFATRCKLGSWWRNTVLYLVIRFLWRLFRKVWRGICVGFSNLAITWKVLLFSVVFSVFTLILASDWQMGYWIFLMLILTVVAMILAVGVHQLGKAGKALASGNMSATVDTSHLFGSLKRHGENLNSIQNGIQVAVDERLKSERLKTELITNVSHDIKTPLTSIINYVDLLKKEPMETDAAREYLEVLDRQSARLKKLIEDLVEASKASTGNIPVQLEDTDVNVLLSQAGGEYETKFADKHLQLVWNLDDSAPHILADGKLLWRVFDNLMNNICKYALEGTRVYLSTAVKDGRVSVTMKNVSRSALNITSDELMERFVRGDSSRNTEGSGLGLSIAKSLAELQHGTFSLEIDGDLFKATVSFDASSSAPF